jgi:hypothetical protein
MVIRFELGICRYFAEAMIVPLALQILTFPQSVQAYPTTAGKRTPKTERRAELKAHVES